MGMRYSSGILAFLLAICIALVSSLLFIFIEGFSAKQFGVWLVLIFLISFALIFITLELLLFKKIKKLSLLMDKLNAKRSGESARSFYVHPLDRIGEDLKLFNETKQMEIENLKKLEAFRKEFIANVSHELKTPIFAAQGFVHTLLDGAMKDKSVRGKFLKKAARSLDGLDALVQELLTLSQIETGQIKMQFERVDLRELTLEVFDQLEEKANKRKIKLHMAQGSGKAIVYADKQRIFQVLTNLIANAIKHSNDGLDVEVGFEANKKSIVTYVRDRGEGIPAEHLPRIFERFYRVDKSRSREKGGTGLGLAIVKHILENHNTKAEVSSKPGSGSEFRFSLPRFEEEQSD